MMEVVTTTNAQAPIRFWDVLLTGGIVVYPTDTLYGLGVDSTNQAAVDRLIALKGRGGPFSVLVGSLSMLAKYALVSRSLQDKLSKQLPGPFTFILEVPTTSPITAKVRGKEKKVGFRIPEHHFIESAYTLHDIPIVTTSVNKTGQQPLADPAAILADFDGSVDLLIDGGVLPSSAGSTIVDATLESWRIVRHGAGALSTL